MGVPPLLETSISVTDCWLSEAIKAVLLAFSLQLFQALVALWFVASARFAAMGDTAASACASLNSPQRAWPLKNCPMCIEYH